MARMPCCDPQLKQQNKLRSFICLPCLQYMSHLAIVSRTYRLPIHGPRVPVLGFGIEYGHDTPLPMPRSPARRQNGGAFLILISLQLQLLRSRPHSHNQPPSYQEAISFPLSYGGVYQR